MSVSNELTDAELETEVIKLQSRISQIRSILRNRSSLAKKLAAYAAPPEDKPSVPFAGAKAGGKP